MSIWALNASRKKGNELVPGSSKYISNELSTQFSIASSNIENHFTIINNQVNNLSQFMSKVYNEEDIDFNNLISSTENSRNASPIKTIDSKIKSSLIKDLEIRKLKDLDEKSEVEPKIVAGQQIKTLEKLNHLIENTKSSINTSDKLSNSTQEDKSSNNKHEPMVDNSIPDNSFQQNQPSNTSFEQNAKSSTNTLDKSLNSTQKNKSSNNKHEPMVDDFLSNNSFQQDQPQNTSFESVSDESFQAISTAIRKSIAGKIKEENNHQKNVPKTPRARSSIFVSLPARDPILLKSASKPKSTTKKQIENNFKLSPVKIIPTTIIPKPQDDTLKTEDVQSSPEKLDLFTSNEPTRNITEEVQPTITLWDKIGQYRALSPKKFSLSPIKFDKNSNLKKSPLKKLSSKSPSKSPIKSSIKLRKSLIKSPIKLSTKSSIKSPVKPQLKIDVKSPTKTNLKKNTTPIRSPTISRLFAQTASSAAKKVQPKRNELKTNRLPSKITRKPLKLNDIPPIEFTNLPKLTKKSMMEQRSEAAALKPRQKIRVNLRKSEVNKSNILPPPITPAKNYTPDNLPEILSDDNHKPLKSWGKTPEIYKITKSKRNIDPSKIFSKKHSVDLLEVFNKQVSSSPVPTPDKNDRDQYYKSLFE
ncbi:hypothetical protein KGF54_001102 [Candida jiufengensis]|uniref:uncharacterized protein n=1 Tax=Candida jiufengensis TaxID=497108 RepID=UPI0022245508|nr:uncharacterized protein KGF54_001102 [Candida jiufengensis]KAI5955600.1 hypothetical protein KGF54_001102 [Candida jiufengensis]